MKTISAPLAIHQSLQESIKGKYSLVEDSLESAEIIIYKDSLNQILIDSHQNQNIMDIVSFKNFEKDKNLEAPSLDHYKEIFSLNFKEESVTEVRNRINKYLGDQNFDGYFSEIERYLKTISTELIQNAIIIGKESLTAKKVEYKLMENAKSWLIQVIDLHGSLTKKHVLEKLARACEEKTFEEKETGAGLGFYMLLNACDKLIFEIDKEKKTKVSVIINKYKRLKDYKSKNISIHFLNNDGE